MSMIIAICNLKGGTGKTTTAILTAMALKRAGKEVSVVDLDPQGSATEWEFRASEAEDALPFTVKPGNVHSLRRMTASDWVLLDCPPGTASIIDAAIHAADMVIVPVSPSPMEAERMWDAIDLAKDKPAKVLLTSVMLGTKSYQELNDAMEQEGVPRFKTVIPRRESIRRLYGTSPTGSLQGYESVARELMEGN